MDAISIDGKALAGRLHSKLTEDVAAHIAAGNKTPVLAVVLVGEDPASKVYVKAKSRKAIAAGMQVRDVTLGTKTSDIELQSVLHELSRDPDINGILLQLPLPAGLDEFAALLSITPEKDVDGLHPYNQGLLLRSTDCLKPCTPYGCMLLIEEACRLLRRDMDLSGLSAVVLGRSILVGKPMASLLLEANCTTTVCHSRTKNLVHHCSQADVLVAAVGRAEMISAEHIKPGAIVIDVGINRGSDGQLLGDVNFDACLSQAAAITPVPGGVGPMTITVLLQNTLKAAIHQL